MNTRNTFLPTVIAFITLLGWFSLFHRTKPPVDDSMVVLTANDTHQWYRGNLHTHSLWSDGDDFTEMIALWYRDHDYDFLSFTDHNITHDREKWVDVDKRATFRQAYEKLKEKFDEDWITSRKNGEKLEVQLKSFKEVSDAIAIPGEYLLIQGEEITDRFKGAPVHMNATHVAEMLTPLGGESIYDVMQNNVNAVIAQRERTKQPMIIHLNHPNFGYAVTAEDLMKVIGENFFEVYNGHPGVNDSGDEHHASTERIWDIILAHRITELHLPLMFGLATDDGHNYHSIPSRKSEPGRGWVMVLSHQLGPEQLVHSLELGRFYSSSGVSLKSVRHNEHFYAVEVDTEPGVEYTIDFIGTKSDYDRESHPVLDKDGKPVRATRIYSNDIGQTLKSYKSSKAVYRFSGDELYVRARVTASRQHSNPSEVGEFERAWTQPIYGPAGRTIHDAAEAE